MKTILEVLKEIGFEERESKIYLSLLKEQEQTALSLSRNTKIDRTTIYDLLEKLIQKGIVSQTTKNNSKTYKALESKSLLTHFKEKYSSLELILPLLTSMQSKKQEKLSCELFQGKEGLKTPLKELIETGKDYKAINITREFEEILGYFIDSGVLKLNESNAEEMIIAEKNAKFKKLKNGKYKFLDKKLLSPLTTVIYQDTVLFILWTEPYFAIRIKNKQFAQAQEEYFSLLWQLAQT